MNERFYNGALGYGICIVVGLVIIDVLDIPTYGTVAIVFSIVIAGIVSFGIGMWMSKRDTDRTDEQD